MDKGAFFGSSTKPRNAGFKTGTFFTVRLLKWDCIWSVWLLKKFFAIAFPNWYGRQKSLCSDD
jgi:hypothetical protein